MQKRIIEICANSVESCIEAERGGATRVELCAGIPEGGTTPSYGEILATHNHTSINIHAIIRPRGGDFCYTDLERETMIADIEMCRKLGIDGVVFGCLLPDGNIDTELLQCLVAAAKPSLSVTFHRAFDACLDPFKALEEIIACGCDRILTSGQQPNAEQGIPLLKELVETAGDRIIIMPGCGVNSANIQKIEQETGAKEFHLSARSRRESPMTFRREALKMGSVAVTSEFERMVSDEKLVREVVFRT